LEILETGKPKFREKKKLENLKKGKKLRCLLTQIQSQKLILRQLKTFTEVWEQIQNNFRKIRMKL